MYEDMKFLNFRRQLKSVYHYVDEIMVKVEC